MRPARRHISLGACILVLLSGAVASCFEAVSVPPSGGGLKDPGDTINAFVHGPGDDPIRWRPPRDIDQPRLLTEYAQSSTIILGPLERQVLVTSPDDGRVAAHGLHPDYAPWFIEVSGQPAQLSLSDGVVVVSRSRDRHITTFPLEDYAAGRPSTAEIETSCGGTHGVVAFEADDGKTYAALTCPYDDRVIVVDVDEKTQIAELPAPTRPSGIALTRGWLLSVTSSNTSQRFEYDLPAILAGGRAVHHRIEIRAEEAFGFTRHDAIAVNTLTREPVSALQLVRRDEDRDAPPPAKPPYGTPGAGQSQTAKIEPMLFGAGCMGLYADFNDFSRKRHAGPTALAHDPLRNRMWVVHQFTGSVSVIDCDTDTGQHVVPDGGFESSRLALHASERMDQARLSDDIRTGHGARGIVLSQDGTRAFVDAGFDHVIRTYTIRGREELADSVRVNAFSRETGAMHLSTRAQLGRILFHTSLNTHITPNRVVACASCHPGGGDDGITWFIHAEGVTRRLRRTAPAWNARHDAAPFHWDGEFEDGAAVARSTIRELMGGDALLVDLNAIAEYMNEVPAPIGKPMSPEDQALAERGEQLFSETLACSRCHAGRLTTDNRAHVVAPDSRDPDGVMADGVITRPLHGVRARAPFLHDGRAPTLRSIHEAHNPDDAHGVTSTLSDTDRTALVRYLETL